MEEWLSAIANFGFPIVITGYLLLRMETKLDKLTEAIQALKETQLKKEVDT
jgi:hypothetical protein